MSEENVKPKVKASQRKPAIHKCRFPECGATFDHVGKRNGHEKSHKSGGKEELVNVYVNPVVTINGKEYAGSMTVSPELANTLNAIMEAHRQVQSQVGVFVDHGTKSIGQV